MAREEKAGGDKGKVRVRVIEFEMEGSNQTLRESIRDIVGAIGRTPQIRGAAPPKGLANGATPAAAAPVDEELIEVEEPIVDEEGADDDTPTTPRKRSAPRSPTVLDIDLKQGKMPLADFLTKLAPQGDMDKYAAIAYWLKTQAGIPEVTMDHIHTGYRAMKWNTPGDAGQPLRNMKKREYGYMRGGSKAGHFELIHIGDNHVNDLMKKAGISLDP